MYARSALPVEDLGGVDKAGDASMEDVPGELSEWPTAACKSALRQSSSVSVDQIPGLAGGKRSARSAAPTESSMPNPCTFDAWTAKGESAEGGGTSTESVGSMTSSPMSALSRCISPDLSPSPRDLISCSACLAATTRSSIFSRTTATLVTRSCGRTRAEAGECGSVYAWGRAVHPEAVMESDVVLRTGVRSSADVASGDPGFDRAFPTRKRSKNAGAEDLLCYFGRAADMGARSEGFGFECAGGRK